MDRRGQALVEFIIILPIFLLIVISAIDFGNVLYQKYRLENSLDYVISLQNDSKEMELKEYTNSEKIIYDYNETTKVITIKKKVDVYSPILKSIFNDPYFIETEGRLYE